VAEILWQGAGYCSRRLQKFSRKKSIFICRVFICWKLM